MQVTWTDRVDPTGNTTHEFCIHRDGRRDITGAVWTPSTRQGNTLVCFGHGASGDRYQAPICHLAQRFSIGAGLASLSLDGPVHGLRQSGPGGRTSFGPEFQRKDCLSDMTEEWQLAISVVEDKFHTAGIAYFGLSMGTIFGLPLVASRSDVRVATLGLFGVQDTLPHQSAFLTAAQKVTCPLLYLMQLDDELFGQRGYLQIFEAINSKDKRLHANPGLHHEVPNEEISFAYDFMVRYITGEVDASVVNIIAD